MSKHLGHVFLGVHIVESGQLRPVEPSVKRLVFVIVCWFQRSTLYDGRGGTALSGILAFVPRRPAVPCCDDGPGVAVDVGCDGQSVVWRGGWGGERGDAKAVASYDHASYRTRPRTEGVDPRYIHCCCNVGDKITRIPPLGRGGRNKSRAPACNDHRSSHTGCWVSPNRICKEAGASRSGRGSRIDSQAG